MASGLNRLADIAVDTGPLLIILVGPNGAGKTTLYEQRLRGLPLPFINADSIARALYESGAPTGDQTERLAAQLAEQRRQDLISQKESFITETVFSDPVGAKVDALKAAQASGYRIVLLFVCVTSAELSALRVQTRVLAGGHDVPPDRIAPRYERMRKNVRAALAFVDYAILLDNSALDHPLRPVAVVSHGHVVERAIPLPWWAAEVLTGLSGR